MSAWELVPAETRAERATPFGEGASTRGDDSGHRARQCTREGEQITLQWIHTPLRSSAGEVVQVASLGLDVTRQEQMEQALRVSETKFSSVFQHSPDALLLIRMRDRHLIDANRAVERLLGVPMADFQAHWSAYGDFFLRTEDLARFRARLAAGDGVEAFETELRRRDGEPLAVLLSARPLQIGGEATLLVTIRDLTPIREGEAERNRLQQQLQQAQHLEGIGRLAGGVAHDFNNMLAGIQGYAELIDAQSREPGQVSLYAERILEATQRAADLVGKLLTFSRQGSIEKRYFGLDAVVRDTLDLFAQSLDPHIRLVPRADERGRGGPRRREPDLQCPAESLHQCPGRAGPGRHHRGAAGAPANSTRPLPAAWTRNSAAATTWC
ncbi:MAG: PAS domain S-box protein [Gammaproteobacteria bacterium]|nr:PAS domain S-box protein [Gammaproteobacteria bacterium]